MEESKVLSCGNGLSHHPWHGRDFKSDPYGKLLQVTKCVAHKFFFSNQEKVAKICKRKKRVGVRAFQCSLKIFKSLKAFGLLKQKPFINTITQF